MVDRDLRSYDAGLAERVQVIPGLDARLAFLDPEEGEDNYHVLQGLKDPQLEEGADAQCCYFYQRSGSTGTRGSIQVEGPVEQPKVARSFKTVFQDKTGKEWGTAKAGDEALPGKFWLQQQATPDLAAQWQYHVSDGVDGKAKGWYPYEALASEEVEELYAQHVANERGARTAVRIVSSGYFRYQVDLENMSQTNQRTKKARIIRRAVGSSVIQIGGAPAKKARAAPKAPVKVTAKAKADRKKPGPKPTVAAKRKPDPRRKAAAKKAAVKKAPMKAKAKAKPRPMKKVVMKPMKAKAKKRVSKIGTLRQVLLGLREKTKTGKTKDDYMRNRSGRIVTKKRNAKGHRIFDKIEKWVKACKEARKDLDIKGFTLIKKGTPFYSRAREVYDKLKTGGEDAKEAVESASASASAEGSADASASAEGSADAPAASES